ncbi:Conserved_hypothetical protein [Hexamita inflata]|uniref:LSM domain-containing protein n=1 Tax=Hexamita inflata TaxID=28002 RepID=A0AA86Q9I8_9EUKA|nr:Conserved hypothetical protein [Hexamita inflata]
MPQSDKQNHLNFLQQYLDKNITILTTKDIALSGKFKALEYDRSIMLESVSEYLIVDEDHVEIPTQQQNQGWIQFSRRSLIIPGKLIKKIILNDIGEKCVE